MTILGIATGTLFLIILTGLIISRHVNQFRRNIKPGQACSVYVGEERQRATIIMVFGPFVKVKFILSKREVMYHISNIYP